MATRVTEGTALPRACTALTKSEEKERLLAVYLYRSILSMMLAMFQSLKSFPLHHFLSPKMKFLYEV